MKNFLKILLALFVVGNIFASNVHAEIKTYTGVGDYVLSEDVPPGDIKSKAKMYAEKNALEQAGIFVSGLTEVKNHIVSKDEIITIVGGILKIIDTKFEIIPLNDAAGIAKYRATVIAQVDTDLLDAAIKNWLNRDANEKANLVQQNKSQQQTIADLQNRIAELEKQAANAKTAQDRKNVQANFAEIDKETLAVQKVEEGNALYEQKNYQGAISKYNEAIKLNPNSDIAYFKRGEAFLFNKRVIVVLPSGDRYNMSEEVALDSFTKAIELNSNYAEAYCARGNVYFMRSEYDKAISDFSKIIELEPNNISYYLYRSLVYKYSKNYKQEISDYTKIIKLQPKFAAAYCYRGLAYFCLEDYSLAISDYTKAIQFDPNYSEAYRERGRAYGILHNFQQAIVDLTKAIQLNPTDADSYYYRGICCQALENYEQAEMDFAKARELGYNG